MERAISSFHGRKNLLGFSRLNPNRSLLCYRPLVVRMAQKQNYWANIEADIQTHLNKAIPIRPPISVFEPMHYLTFAAPRTTAPALCIAACELVGGDRTEAMAAAAALHLMHAASYTHQHLPLTDRPRPKPTIEHKFNPNIELLTADGIMPFGFELLAESMDSGHINADRILRVIVEISQATGSRGVVDGQFRGLDLTQSDNEGSSDLGLIEYVSKKKDGELHACAAACGAILGGGSEEEIETLRKYGLYAGMIQGLLYGVGRNEKGVKEMVEKLRTSAMKELESFKYRETEAISSLVEAELISSF